MGCDVTTGADRVLATAADALAGCVDFAVGDGAGDLADGSSAVKPTDSVALMRVFAGVDAGHRDVFSRGVRRRRQQQELQNDLVMCHARSG